jgi:hypothetical protein
MGFTPVSPGYDEISLRVNFKNEITLSEFQKILKPMADAFRFDIELLECGICYGDEQLDVYSRPAPLGQSILVSGFFFESKKKNSKELDLALNQIAWNLTLSNRVSAGQIEISGPGVKGRVRSIPFGEISAALAVRQLQAREAAVALLRAVGIYGAIALDCGPEPSLSRSDPQPDEPDL